MYIIDLNKYIEFMDIKVKEYYHHTNHNHEKSNYKTYKNDDCSDCTSNKCSTCNIYIKYKVSYHIKDIEGLFKKAKHDLSIPYNILPEQQDLNIETRWIKFLNEFLNTNYILSDSDEFSICPYTNGFKFKFKKFTINELKNIDTYNNYHIFDKDKVYRVKLNEKYIYFYNYKDASLFVNLYNINTSIVSVNKNNINHDELLINKIQ